MLSKTHAEDGGIKTVTLARGTFSGLSPPGPPSIASGRTSARSSIPHIVSPDARERSDPLRLLGSVGIVELLEQDTRPTFIVDLDDFANYAPESSGLQLLFANCALRSSPTTWETVVGKVPKHGASIDETGTHAARQFHGWLLSTAAHGDGSHANPSPIEHGGIVWSCYTLRKRFRVCCADAQFNTAGVASTNRSNEFAIPSGSSTALVSANNIDTLSSMQESEPQDYFGSASTTTNTVLSVADIHSTPPSAQSQYTANHATANASSNSTSVGIFQKSSGLKKLPLEDSPSFTNECVLSAHTAGDIDPFSREANTSSPDHDMGFFDWTRLSLSPSLPPHIQFARSVDWASTPLGPTEYWSNDLRAMCNLIM